MEVALVLLVEGAFVAVGVERETSYSGWWCGHELADRLHGHAGVVEFVDDCFIMDVHDNLVPGFVQGVECVGE